MKYIYIAGLEHSGTTLINHLIAQHPKSVGLGEVGSFFSADHMRWYLDQWGDYPDVRLCSCGKDWDECKFWGGKGIKRFVHCRTSQRQVQGSGFVCSGNMR